MNEMIIILKIKTKDKPDLVNNNLDWLAASNEWSIDYLKIISNEKEADND